MPIPFTTSPIPTLSNDQLSFQGLTLGAGTPFGLVSLEGLGKPDVRSGNTDRSRTRGAFVGLNLLKTRTVTVTMDVGPSSHGVPQLTNLIPNPSFEHDTPSLPSGPAGWAFLGSSGSTYSIIQVEAVHGSDGWAAQGHQSLTVGVTLGSGAGAYAGVHTGLLGVNASTSYAASVTCNIVTLPAGSIVLLVSWYDAGSALISQTQLASQSGTAIATLSGTATSPSNAAYADIQVVAQDAPGDTIAFDMDAVMFVATTTVPTYFDGDATGYEWAGSAGDSASIPVPGWGLYGPYGDTLAGALTALRNACSTEGTTEYPLWIKLPNTPQVACMARVVKGPDPKYDITADLGGLIRSVPIQFEATDPYLYTPVQNTAVGLRGPSGGFNFPITFPLSFGGSDTPNQMSVTNSGDVECWPLIIITGPCLNPTVQNTTATGGPTLSFNIQLNAGDELIVDCDQQSIMYAPSGNVLAAPYPEILNAGSTFFSLAAGTTSVIAFNSQDTAPVSGICGLLYSNAYSGITG